MLKKVSSSFQSTREAGGQPAGTVEARVSQSVTATKVWDANACCFGCRRSSKVQQQNLAKGNCQGNHLVALEQQGIVSSNHAFLIAPFMFSDQMASFLIVAPFFDHSCDDSRVRRSR
jgi:hypothetical protein